MPAAGQTASQRDRLRLPELREEIGEDPAQYLDRPMFRNGPVDIPLRTAIARIQGMERIDVVNAWLMVERRLDRGPRDKIVELLEDRRDYLEEHGERPRDIPALDGPPRYTPREVRDVESVDVTWPDREDGDRSGSATSKLSGLRGGDDV